MTSKRQVLKVQPSLKNGETIQVLYKANSDADASTIRILSDAFPKNVATTFSTKWKKEFPPLNKMKVGDIRNAVLKKSVVVVGANVETYKEILQWMLESCEGRGLAKIPTTTWKPFTHLFLLRACAKQIGCDYLVKEANKQMDKIAETQIHSEDVRALWDLSPPDTEMREFLAQHVAIRFWEKRLKAVSAYLTLRMEFPELDKAVNDFCAIKKAERAEEKKKLWEQKKKERDAKRGMRYGGYGREKRAHVCLGGRKFVADEGEQKAKTKTLKLEVVRKATKNQPAYAKLDLGEIGLTKEQFVGRRRTV
jgi:hypothetical protein